MKQLTLERYQVWIYLVTITFGLGLGTAEPDLSPLLWAFLVMQFFCTGLSISPVVPPQALATNRPTT